MSPHVDVQPLRIALLTHSTLPRGGVVHALAVGDALADAGHHVRLLAPVQPGEALFREPRSPRCRFIGVPATQMSRVEPTHREHSEHPEHPAKVAAADHSRHATAGDQDALVRLVRQRIDDWMRYFDTTPDAFDADIFHAQDSISANALANLVDAGRLPGFVRTVHHLDVFADPRLAAWQRRGFRAASQVCCVSEVWQEKLWRDEGIDAAMVRNGVDRYRFSPEPDGRDSAVQSMRIASHESRDTIAAPRVPIFLSVGGVEARKNTLNALAAFVLWRKQADRHSHSDPAEDEEAKRNSSPGWEARPDAVSSLKTTHHPGFDAHPEADAHLRCHHAQWWIAGGASLLDHRDYGQRFLSMAASAGLRVGRTLDSTADIVLLGRIDDALMPALFRAADALLFPSLVEGFGLVVLEALSVGIPVITSRIAPFTEYLPDAAVEWADPLVPRSIADAMRRAVPFTYLHTTRAASSASARVLAGSAEAADEQATHKLARSEHAADQDSEAAHAADQHLAPERRRQAGFAVAESFSWANSACQHSELYRHWQQHSRPLVIASRTLVSEQESHHA